MLASTALCAVLAHGGMTAWPALAWLAFVAFVPWLRVLDGVTRDAGALAAGAAMAAGYGAAVYGWFGSAVGGYTGLGAPAGIALAVLAAPLWQPQFLALAWVRHRVRRRHGPLAGALAGAAAWLAVERFAPRLLLGDTFGIALQPLALLRQAADLGGAPLLTLAVLLAAEALAAALARLRRDGGGHRRWRDAAPALAVAAALPLALAAYGAAALARHGAMPGTGTGMGSGTGADAAGWLRVAMVQSAIVDYERLRRERGAGEVVREVLDVHFAMSHDAVERHRADAVLWSETVYPTTFGQPKSEAGAAFDAEIRAFVDAAGVPFVFGTYDRDAAGEYNAAAFVTPGRAAVERYRKARPFPLTEAVPAALDGPALRRLLPWAGAWRAGDGAHVLPLRLADGREVPVLPLICLDAMDPRLVLDGARLGARAILALSNDSWFTGAGGGAHAGGDGARPGAGTGAALHAAAAALLSVQTRLPQFRVTPDGHSAVIDATGEVRAGSRIGQRTLVVGALPVPEPPRTLAVAWGDWVGQAAAAALVLPAAAALARRWRRRRGAPAPGRSQGRAAHHEALSSVAPLDAASHFDGVGGGDGDVGSTPVRLGVGRLAGDPTPDAWTARLAVLSPAARVTAGALRGGAGAAALGLALLAASGSDAWPAGTLAQLRLFSALVLAPAAAGWWLQRAFAAQAWVEGDRLTFMRGAHRLTLPLRDIAAVRAWRLPLPAMGATLQRAGGGRWRYGLAGVDAATLAQALAAAAAAPVRVVHPSTAADARAQARQAQARSRGWRWLAHPLLCFGALPLALALPAFRLHQQIAFGSAFGEWLVHGPRAYAAGLALWWAAWAMAAVLCAAVLRAAVEVAAAIAAWAWPSHAAAVRLAAERAALVLLYAGLPAWLLWRAVLA